MDQIKGKPIFVVKTYDEQIQFIESCKKLYTLSIQNNTSTFCGIDFEFNMNWKIKERYIGSIQIIFIFDNASYHDSDYEKPVYILNPLMLSKNHKILFIKYILCSRVVKIFHGSDSLDYPHIYKDILKQNKRKFIRFINNSVDTRFMCEFSKHIMVRAGVLDVRSKKCSIYNALLDHNAIDIEMFNKLEKISSKINYNKPWIIENLTEVQIVYSAHDVMHLYDLLEKITHRIKPVKDISDNIDRPMDPLSLVNRMYRFHILNRLGICKLSLRCKNMFDKYHFDKKRIESIDQKIMEKYLTTIEYTDNQSNIHKIDLTFDDVLFVDTLRKSTLSCLRVYETDMPRDIETIDKYLTESHIFKLIKGQKSIKKMMRIVNTKPSQVDKIRVVCE
jgi:hypothetical protein